MFELAVPGLDGAGARRLGLVYGVLAKSGRWTDGRTMPAKNVVEGAASLRAVATHALAICDIDHYFPDKLPDAYSSKFPGIDDPKRYVGHVIDAEALESKDGGGAVELHAIMSVHNRTAYGLIESGVIHGCSVVDMPRGVRCHSGQCEYESSTYLLNTFAIAGRPHSPGTFVRPVVQADLDSGLITEPRVQRHADASPMLKMLMERLLAAAPAPAAAGGR